MDRIFAVADTVHRPRLVERGVADWVARGVRSHVDKRNAISNFLFNLGALLAFIGVVAAILFTRYKTKRCDQDIVAQRDASKQKVLSMLSSYANERSKHNMITTLPTIN